MNIVFNIVINHLFMAGRIMSYYEFYSYEPVQSESHETDNNLTAYIKSLRGRIAIGSLALVTTISGLAFYVENADSVSAVAGIEEIATPTHEVQVPKEKALLDVIAKGESTGNYNAYFGNPGNNSIKFTEMPVGEVLNWQKKSVNNAVGKYQFIDETLRELITELNISESTIFDAELQDRLAAALLQRRGIDEYLESRITREEFAHNLSKEWAALPQVMGDDPSASYYAENGIDRAQLSIEEIMAGINSLGKPQNSN